MHILAFKMILLLSKYFIQKWHDFYVSSSLNIEKNVNYVNACVQNTYNVIHITYYILQNYEIFSFLTAASVKEPPIGYIYALLWQLLKLQ